MEDNLIEFELIKPKSPKADAIACQMFQEDFSNIIFFDYETWFSICLYKLFLDTRIMWMPVTSKNKDPLVWTVKPDGQNKDKVFDVICETLDSVNLLNDYCKKANAKVG